MKEEIIQGDCLEVMKDIPDGSIDCIITDPPYGNMKGINETFAGYGRKNHDGHNWDTQIDRKEMLSECNRILRMNGALLLFSQEPYTSELVINAHGNLPFSYRLNWLKNDFANALLVNKAPVSYVEDICVFFKKYDTQGQHPLREYTKQLFDFIGKDKNLLFKEMGHQGVCHFMRYDSMQFGLCTEKTYDQLCSMYSIDKQSWYRSFNELEGENERFNKRFNKRFNLPEGKKYKSNVLEYKKDYTGFHPTQKPLALIEDLVKTYTNEGDVILDFTAGSGTTGVACKNLNRQFILIEKEPEYIEIIKKRLSS